MSHPTFPTSHLVFLFFHIRRRASSFSLDSAVPLMTTPPSPMEAKAISPSRPRAHGSDLRQRAARSGVGRRRRSCSFSTLTSRRSAVPRSSSSTSSPRTRSSPLPSPDANMSSPRSCCREPTRIAGVSFGRDGGAVSQRGAISKRSASSRGSRARRSSQSSWAGSKRSRQPQRQRRRGGLSRISQNLNGSRGRGAHRWRVQRWRAVRRWRGMRRREWQRPRRPSEA